MVQRIPGWIAASLILLAVTVNAPAQQSSNPAQDSAENSGMIAKTSVGLPAEIEQLVIPGDLLQVSPLENRNAPFVLRILQSYPHGTDHRYDLEFYALEPGRYNLSEFLQRSDGSPAPPADLWVEVESTLPAGQVLPETLAAEKTPVLGGYRTAWILGSIFWLGGLAAILLWLQPNESLPTEIIRPQLSLADRLRPLIEKASTGTLRGDEQSILERTCIAFWAEHLKVSDLPPGDLIRFLKQHETSGPFINQLETWLHQPGQRLPVDIEPWLAPYKGVTRIPAELGDQERGS